MKQAGPEPTFAGFIQAIVILAIMIPAVGFPMIDSLTAGEPSAVLAFSAGADSGPAAMSRIERARQLIEDRENDLAMDLLLEALEDDEADAEAHFLLAKVLLRKQEHDQAKHHAKRAVDLDGSVSEYHMWLARAYLAKATESGFINAFRYARKGKKSYEKAVELDSANVEARLELCMYLVAAPGLVGGSVEKGREQAMVVEEQDSLYGSYAWASVLERDGDVEGAETYLERAVRLDTTSTFYARYALGHFYERNGRLEEAGEVFRAIMADDPDEMGAVFQVGKICVITGSNLAEAEALFKRYLEGEVPPNAPSRAAAHWRLGMVYDLQGRPEQAVEEMRKAVELAPDNRDFRKSLKQTQKKLQEKPRE
jgi:tetratricopeptide (TPR) repeat protein